jgi:hypothetical protein
MHVGTKACLWASMTWVAQPTLEQLYFALAFLDTHIEGRLALAIGRILSTWSDLRSVGDYGGATHVSHAEANRALREAQQFLEAIRALLPADIGNVAPESATNPDVGEYE